MAENHHEQIQVEVVDSKKAQKVQNPYSPDIAEIMRTSLKKDRWTPLELSDKKSYSAQMVQDRWTLER